VTYTLQNDLCYIKSVQDIRFMTERVRDATGKCAAPKRSAARNRSPLDIHVFGDISHILWVTRPSTWKADLVGTHCMRPYKKVM